MPRIIRILSPYGGLQIWFQILRFRNPGSISGFGELELLGIESDILRVRLPQLRFTVRLPHLIYLSIYILFSLSHFRVRYPRIGYPRLRFTRLRFPSLRFPSLRYPRIRYPRLRYPRLRYPRLSYPRLRYPRLRYPRLRYFRLRFPRLRYFRLRFPRLRFGGRGKKKRESSCDDCERISKIKDERSRLKICKFWFNEWIIISLKVPLIRYCFCSVPILINRF